MNLFSSLRFSRHRLYGLPEEGTSLVCILKLQNHAISLLFPPYTACTFKLLRVLLGRRYTVSLFNTLLLPVQRNQTYTQSLLLWWISMFSSSQPKITVIRLKNMQLLFVGKIMQVQVWITVAGTVAPGNDIKTCQVSINHAAGSRYNLTPKSDLLYRWSWNEFLCASCQPLFLIILLWLICVRTPVIYFVVSFLFQSTLNEYLLYSADYLVTAHYIFRPKYL